MGSLTRQRARNRLTTALEQRLEAADSAAAERAIYQDVVDRLCRIAIDATELDRLAQDLADTPDSISVPDSPDGIVQERPIDLDTAGWTPGDPCPACGHTVVHAIVRAGMQFHADGGWDYDETLVVYEAFCPDCDWLPPVSDGTGHPSDGE